MLSDSKCTAVTQQYGLIRNKQVLRRTAVFLEHNTQTAGFRMHRFFFSYYFLSYLKCHYSVLNVFLLRQKSSFVLLNVTAIFS